MCWGFFLAARSVVQQGGGYTLTMLWIKSLHIVFVASWFAGLFYLPRIFVNLAMVAPESLVRSAVTFAGDLSEISRSPSYV